MGRNLTRFTRPITRVVGNLVITMDESGVELRGLRKRVLKKRITWEQIAALDDDPLSICHVAETNAGRGELNRLGAVNPR